MSAHYIDRGSCCCGEQFNDESEYAAHLLAVTSAAIDGPDQ